MTVLADLALPGTVGGPRAGAPTPVPLRRTRRRPAVRRPGGRPLSYAGLPPAVGVSRAPHAPSAAQVRRRRVAAWVVLGVLAVVAVTGLVALRSAGVAVVPSSTAVVQVQAGENLSELAGRLAPSAPTAAVVDRIVELNGLPGVGVRPGESLVVPVG